MTANASAASPASIRKSNPSVTGEHHNQSAGRVASQPLQTTAQALQDSGAIVDRSQYLTRNQTYHYPIVSGAELPGYRDPEYYSYGTNSTAFAQKLVFT